MTPAQLTFHPPLTADGRRRAIAALASGRVRRIDLGARSLLPRLAQGHIRGIEAGGGEHIVGDVDRDGPEVFERALDWALEHRK